MSSNVPNNDNVVEKPHKLSFKKLFKFSKESINNDIKLRIPGELLNKLDTDALYNNVYKETKEEFKSKNLHFEYDPISLSNEGLFNPELNKYIDENDEKKTLNEKIKDKTYRRLAHYFVDKTQGEKQQTIADIHKQFYQLVDELKDFFVKKFITKFWHKLVHKLMYDDWNEEQYPILENYYFDEKSGTILEKQPEHVTANPEPPAGGKRRTRKAKKAKKRGTKKAKKSAKRKARKSRR